MNSWTPQNPHPSRSASYKWCQNCGASNKQDALHCVRCGIPFPSPPKQQSANTGLLIGCIIPILVAIITAIVGPIIIAKINEPKPTPTVPIYTPTPSQSDSTPQPSIPQLHRSYTGTLTTSVNTLLYPLTLSSLQEDSSGHFSASGNDGSCQATFQGIIHSDNSMNFTETQANTPDCGLTSSYQGILYPDGHLGGTWQGPDSVTHGTWSIS